MCVRTIVLTMSVLSLQIGVLFKKFILFSRKRKIDGKGKKQY